MSLTLRKIILLTIIACIFLVANIMVVTNWLNNNGAPAFAEHIKNHYLTGTAITIIIALLILLTNPKTTGKIFSFSRTCPVCDKRLAGNSNYCSECGSKV